MSVDLRDQLAEYGRHLEAAQRPVGVAEVVPPDDAVRPVPLVGEDAGRHWRRNLLVAATAAAAVILLVGAVAFAARWQTVEPADQSTVTSVPPDQTTIATTTTLAGDTAPGRTIGEVVTPSSIGDLRWTMIEGGPSVILEESSPPTPIGLARVVGGELLVSEDALE